MTLIFESNNIKIYNNTNFWFYVINDIQYKIIKDNLDDGLLYFSSYKHFDLKKDDVVFILVRSKHKSNFVWGVIQIDYDMKVNKKKIKIFSDNTINKNYVESSFFIDFDTIKINSFVNIINKYYSKKYLFDKTIKGDCFFVKTYKNFGIELFKFCINEVENSSLYTDNTSEIIEYTETNIQTDNNSNFDIVDIDDIDDIDDEDDGDEDDNEDDDDGDEEDEEDDDGDEDDDDDDNEDDDNEGGGDDEDEDGKRLYESEDSEDTDDCDSEDVEDNEEIFMSNIPVLLVKCKKLKKSLKNDEKNKTKYILRHVLNCDNCEIVNNNNTSIKNTIDNIDIGDIETDYSGFDYDEIYDCYRTMKRKDLEKDDYYLKITSIDNMRFSDEYLIEYTSKIKKCFCLIND